MLKMRLRNDGDAENGEYVIIYADCENRMDDSNGDLPFSGYSSLNGYDLAISKPMLEYIESKIFDKFLRCPLKIHIAQA